MNILSCVIKMQTINPGDNTDLCSVPLPVQNYHNHRMLLGRKETQLQKETDFYLF